jgi:hypothetical protein
MATLEDYFFTKKTKWFLWGAFALILAALIFHAGVVVGSRQTVHGRLELRGPGMFGFMPSEAYVEGGNGAVGTIKTLTLPTLTLETRDGTMQEVYVSTSTIITDGATHTSTLQAGEVVIVIGDPNDSDDQGILDARIIHVLPPPPTQASSSISL